MHVYLLHKHTYTYTRTCRCIIHAHTCIHRHIHAYIDTYMHTYIHTQHTHAYVNTCHTHANTLMFAARHAFKLPISGRSRLLPCVAMRPVPVVVYVLWGLELHQSPLLTRNADTRIKICKDKFACEYTYYTNIGTSYIHIRT